jgi:hypothetical protein
VDGRTIRRGWRGCKNIFDRSLASDWTGGSKAKAELGGGFAVTEEAEGAEIVEVALAAAFGYGEDVVGVPEASARGNRLHTVEAEAGDAGGASGSFEGVVGGDGVDATGCADAAVAAEDLIAEVTGVGAETPLVDAIVGAEGAAAFSEDFEVAPAAERQVVGAERQGFAGGAAAWEGAGDEHTSLRIGPRSRFGDDEVDSLQRARVTGGDEQKRRDSGSKCNCVRIRKSDGRR